jgi:hypothetical protein
MRNIRKYLIEQMAESLQNNFVVMELALMFLFPEIHPHLNWIKLWIQVILRSLDGLSNEETTLYTIQGLHTTPYRLRKVSVLGFAMKTEGLSEVFKNSLF